MSNKNNISEGFSILSNLGINIKEEVSDEDPFRFIVRPKVAGVSADVDGTKQDLEIKSPLKAWRKYGPDISEIIKEKKIPKGDKLCTVNQFLEFQSSICKFHRNFKKSNLNAEQKHLQGEAESLSNRITFLNEKKIQISEKKKIKKEALKLIDEVLASQPLDYDKGFLICSIISKNPSFIESLKQDKKFLKKSKNVFSPKQFALNLAESYSEEFFGDVFSDDLSPWVKVFNWLQNVESDDNLWSKYLRKLFFPEIKERLSLKSSTQCTILIKGLIKAMLMDSIEIQYFFTAVCQQFLVSNLSSLCSSHLIYDWVALSSKSGQSKLFASIVRQHADIEFQKYPLNSSIAISLIKQWPNVLGGSPDFIAKTIIPKLKLDLEIGRYDALAFWEEYISESTLASIVADSMIFPILKQISEYSKTNPKKSAELYLQIKKVIPIKVIGHPRVIRRLIEALDEMKQHNPFLRCITYNNQKTQLSVSDLLLSLASKNGLSFEKIGFIEMKEKFLIGNKVFYVEDGVLYVENRNRDTPIYVEDFPTLFK